MRKISSGTGMFLYIISIFLFFAVAFICFQHRREKEYKADMLDLQLQEYNSGLAAYVNGGGVLSPEVIEEYLAHNRKPGLRLTVVSADGTVVFDNVEKNYAAMPNHLGRAEISSAMSKGRGYVIDRLSSTTNTKYFYSATFYPGLGIVVRSALPYDQSLRDVLRIDRHFIWFALAVILLLAVVLRIYVRILDGNIARQKELERALTRKQLTQNISHELKTPVAGIMGYLETLDGNPDMDEKTRREFIERGLFQAKRLSSLLEDLSVLNRIDDAPKEWELGDVDISDMVQSMIAELSGKMAGKNISFHNLLPFGIHIRGNTSLVYSIFRNLTDNAVSYAGEGARITLSATEGADFWEFTFRDNGPGVPEADLEHIFERFYRVDKGRSRRLGGTGLGLSIVKNAVLFHGGTISASNDGGLRLDFSLRKG